VRRFWGGRIQNVGGNARHVKTKGGGGGQIH